MVAEWPVGHASGYFPASLSGPAEKARGGLRRFRILLLRCKIRVGGCGVAIKMRGMTPLLQVFDMRRSVEFYRDMLGFEIVANSQPRQEVLFHWALLRRDGIELMLNTAYDEGERPPAPDAKRIAAHDDVTLYFSCPDVDAMYVELHAKGVAKNEPEVAFYGMKQLYIKDPDGYGLCFQWAVKKAVAG